MPKAFVSRSQSRTSIKPASSARQDDTTSPLPSSPAAKPKDSSTQKSVTFATPLKSSSTVEAATAVYFDTKIPPGTVYSGLEDDLAKFTFNSGERVIELDENDKEVASYPVIPVEESAKDAALRREMLQYGLAEVNAVVAEIDLDEGDDSEFDDDHSGDYPETDEEEEEEEDEFGRTLGKVIPDNYRKEMLELEKKLNARMMENVGPQPADVSAPGTADDIRRLVVRPETSVEAPISTIPTAKKRGVRFAQELDVSLAPVPVRDLAGDQHHSSHSPTSKAPLVDAIVERKSSPTDHAAPFSAGTKNPAKISRFKSSRSGPNAMISTKSTYSEVSGEAPPVLDDKATATLANLVVERKILEDGIVAPDENGLDPALLAREVVVEYNKQRNRRIQDQGGFKPSEEEAENPLIEEVDGKEKKVSRFKAARLKSAGV